MKFGKSDNHESCDIPRSIVRCDCIQFGGIYSVFISLADTRESSRSLQGKSFGNGFQVSLTMAEEINSATCVIDLHTIDICTWDSSLYVIFTFPLSSQIVNYSLLFSFPLMTKENTQEIPRAFPTEKRFTQFLQFILYILTLWRGTAGMLLVLLRYCLGAEPPRIPDAKPTGPKGLVGLGPLGLALALRRDDDDTAPGLSAGVLVGLLGEGDRWPQGPASACRNLPYENRIGTCRVVGNPVLA